MQSQDPLDILVSNKSEKNNDNSIYEEDVAQKLDENIENNGEKLMNVPITSLVNIFNHPKRKLTNHNLAYQLIKDYSEKKKDPNIYILVKYIDGEKLSTENMMDAISSKDERNGAMPSIDFKKIYEAIYKINSLEKSIATLNQTINSLTNSISTDVSSKLQKYKEEIKEVNSNEISLLYTNFENKLNAYISQSKKEKELFHTEIKGSQKIFNEELLKKIDEQVKEINKKLDLEIGLQEKSLMIEIKSVSHTVKDDLNAVKTSLESQMETIYDNKKKQWNHIKHY